MSHLPDKLKSAVAHSARPDVDSLWIRGRAAARRRTVTRTLSGLAIVLLVTVTALRLTNPDDAAPVDVVTEIPDRTRCCFS